MNSNPPRPRRVKSVPSSSRRRRPVAPRVSCAARASCCRCRCSTRCSRRSRRPPPSRRADGRRRHAAADAGDLQQPRPAAGVLLPQGERAATTRSRPTSSCSSEHRDDFTVFSGVSHPDVDGGHPADNCFLTAAPHPGSGGFRNTISLDQYIAERIGHLTRFPSLTLGVNVQQGRRSLRGRLRAC